MHVTLNILLWTCLHIYHWMCTLRILQNLNSNTMNIMFTYHYLFTNPSPPWRTPLWSLWNFVMQYIGLLLHISYNTFFYNTLKLATSIFKWRFWCQWIFIFLYFLLSFFLSFLLGFIIWILLLGTTRFLDIVINLPSTRNTVLKLYLFLSFFERAGIHALGWVW